MEKLEKHFSQTDIVSVTDNAEQLFFFNNQKLGHYSGQTLDLIS